MIKCTQWNNNAEAFGCSSKRIKPELQALCKNPKIKGGSNFPPHIYVFRGKNYWKFDNSPKADKPFGELIEGNKSAIDLWPGIHFPGGSSYNKFAFVMVYKNKWSQWKSADSGYNSRSTETEINDEPIGVVEEEAPDELSGDDSDYGPLIVYNEKKGKYAKINGNQICFYIIRDNKCTTHGSCVPVDEEENKFPPNIVSVIRDRDKNWLFFDKNGKYCQRANKDRKEVVISLKFFLQNFSSFD